MGAIYATLVFHTTIFRITNKKLFFRYTIITIPTYFIALYSFIINDTADYLLSIDKILLYIFALLALYTVHLRSRNVYYITNTDKADILYTISNILSRAGIHHRTDDKSKKETRVVLGDESFIVIRQSLNHTHLIDFDFLDNDIYPVLLNNFKRGIKETMVPEITFIEYSVFILYIIVLIMLLILI